MKLLATARGAGTAAMAAAVFTRAGLIRPLSPRQLARITASFRAMGTSPALLVSIAAIRWPGATAVIDDAGEVTFRELEEQADALAEHLADRHGIVGGQGIAILCRNHRAFVQGLLAAGRLGADVLLVNTELPAHQLRLILSRHQPAVVLHDDEFAVRLAEADSGAEISTPRLAVWVQDGPVRFNGPAAGRRDLPRRRGHAGKLILLTSGTTGVPKGVPRAPHPTAYLGVAASSFQRLGLRTGTTTMVCPPAFHGMGLICLLLGLASGSTVVLQRRFEAAAAARAIAEHQVSHLVAVPAMLQRLTALDDLREHSRSLTSVLSGASELSAVVAREFMDVVGDVLFNGYGSSEIGIVTLATPADLRTAPGTVGRPALGTSVLILDDAGRPVPTGQVGQVHVASAMTFDGYTGGGHKDLRDGHLASGDLGHLDATGRLFIDGRADDMIVSGGENVFPQPVEDALLGHSAIADAAVTGVPDPDFGQRLRAFVVLQGDGLDEGDRLDEDEVREHLRARLARFQMPRDIVVVAEIPRNATGKVLRRQLAAPPGGPHVR